LRHHHAPRPRPSIPVADRVGSYKRPDHAAVLLEGGSRSATATAAAHGSTPLSTSKPAPVGAHPVRDRDLRHHRASRPRPRSRSPTGSAPTNAPTTRRFL